MDGHVAFSIDEQDIRSYLECDLAGDIDIKQMDLSMCRNKITYAYRALEMRDLK